MANGRAHNLGTAVVTLLSGAVAYSLSGDAEFSGCVMGGGALTLLVNPDLDVDGLDRSEHALVKHTLGIGFLWLMLWYPYARAFKHRGVSHWPIVGTLTRVIYLGALLTVGLMLAGAQVYIEDAIAVGGYFVVGMMLSDFVHWVMDGIA